MVDQNKRLIITFMIVGFILLIPLIIQQFTDEVNWNWFDFVVAGILLLGTGFLVELVLRKIKKTEHRVAVCLAVLLGFLLIWIELAVGIFGTPIAGS